MSTRPAPTFKLTLDPLSFLKIVGIVLLLWLLYQLRDLLILLFVSGLLASALYPVVAWLKTKRFPRRLSILGFYLLFLLLAGGFAAFTVSLLMQQGEQFLSHFPAMLESALGFISQYIPLEAEGRGLLQIVQSLGNTLAYGARLLLSALNYLLLLGKGLVHLVTVLVLTFFLIMEPLYFEGLLLALFPPQKRGMGQRILRAIPERMGRYLRGQFLVMLAVGLAIWLGLTLLQVPYAFFLGVVSFLLEIVPTLGPILAALIGVLVTLGHDPSMAGWVLLLYFAVQQLENYLLVPFILGRTVGIHPFWTFLSILIGASLMGVAGAVLAIPFATVLHVVYETFSE